MNKDLQVRDAVVIVERAELARAIAVRISGLLMNASARPGSASGVELGFASWIEVTVDGESSGVEDEGFKVERIDTNMTGIELVVLSRDLSQPEEDDDDIEYVVIRCFGDSLEFYVDQKIYTLPSEDFNGVSPASYFMD